MIGISQSNKTMESRSECSIRYNVRCGWTSQFRSDSPSCAECRWNLMLVCLSGFGRFSSVSLPWTVGQASLQTFRGPSAPSVTRPVVLRIRPCARCSDRYTWPSGLSCRRLCSVAGLCLWDAFLVPVTFVMTTLYRLCYLDGHHTYP